MTRLENGQAFPALSIPAIGGGTINIPEALAGSFGVVLIYRGLWCPYCRRQLEAFQAALSKLDEIGIKVVAFSVDDEAAASEMVEKHNLSFPVGHSADADAVSAVLGTYTNPEPHYLQSTGFVLSPQGQVLNAVYSSGPIGRLVVDDVIGMVSYIKSKA